MFGDSSPGTQSNAGATDGRERKERTVLFVGAKPIPPDAISRAFDKFSVSVEFVTDGNQVIERLAEVSASTSDSPPDLVLLEHGFESPDWKTVLLAIKSSPRLGTVPVVVLTPDETDAKTVYTHGGNAHVTTPESPEVYTELLGSFGRFWFEWGRYPSESLSANNL